MSEIKNHRINIKNICSLFCIITLLSAISLCFAIAEKDDENIKIMSLPSHIVFNRWYDNNNVPYNINKNINREITYHAAVPDKKPVGAKIIFKTQNLLIRAYTNGKSLTHYNSNKYSGYGEKYTIIDLDDMGKNKELYIHLIPLTKEDSGICDSIYITTQNEFLLSLFQKAVFPIIIAVAFLILAVYFSIKGIKNIFKFKKYFFAVLLSIDIIFITFYNSTLPCLLTENGTLAYILKYLSAMFFPLLLSFLIKESAKCKSIIFDIYEVSICTYGIIRISLFAYNPSPLNDSNFIHFVLLTVLVLITILHEKQRSKKVKNIS